MKKRLSVFVVYATLLFIFSSICYALPQPLGEQSKEKIIEQYFKDKNIDSIEGIWLTTDNQYEFAIVKNTSSTYREYDYLGIITNTTEKKWEKGEIKLLLKNTSLNQIYSGNYYILQKSDGLWGGSEKKEYGTTFSLKSRNLIECYLPVGLYGSTVKTTFIRTYPAFGSSRGTILQSSGTGFFVTPTLVVTNYHVVADAKEIEISFQNQPNLPATIVAKDPANDLVLLRVTGLEDVVKPVRTSQIRDIKEGIQVFTVGFPLTEEMGTRAKIGEGIVNGVTGFEDDIRMLQISIPVQPGNSGSPLYNSKGEVIGIVTSTLSNKYFINRTGVIPQNVNYAIKINYISMLINMLPEEIKLSETASTLKLEAPQIMDMAKQSVVRVIAK